MCIEKDAAINDAAKKLEFERVADIIDRVTRLRELESKYAGEIT